LIKLEKTLILLGKGALFCMKKKLIYILLFVFTITLGPLAANQKSKSPLESLAEKATPAVVFVGVKIDHFESLYATNPASYYSTFPTFYEWCVRPFYEWIWPPGYAHGSGFFIDQDGYIVTNFHVVAEAQEVFVCVPSQGNEIYKAKVVGTDFRTDLAVLKIENTQSNSFSFLKFGNSHSISVGQQVAAIGNPMDEQLALSFTSGVVSGLDRNFYSPYEIEGHIQTDTPISGGNSGGPLLNLNGEVIGINSWSLSYPGVAENLNFAIPSNTAALVVDQLIKNGRVSQGFLGIELEASREVVFDYFVFNKKDELTIGTIFDNSPASRANLREGDRLLSINGCPIGSEESLRNYMYVLKPGTNISLEVQRYGQIHTVSIELDGNEELTDYLFFHYLTGGSLVI